MNTKIHGHTRITLRNPISGNILKDVESENVFQSAYVAKYLSNCGSNGGIFYDSTVRTAAPWHQFIGGLLLFQNTEQEGTQYMTAGNRMIGKGAFEVTNNADPVELGSYNSNESSQSYNTITQVYDFSTQQANGQISCVSLTSRIGGIMGYGNASQKCFPRYSEWVRPFAPYDYQAIQSVNPQEAIDWRARALVGNYEFDFVWDDTEKKLNIGKWKVPVRQGSVFDGLCQSLTVDCSSLDYSVVLRDGLKVASTSGTKIYIAGNADYNVQPSGTWKYWEYDTTNNTITEKTFTNTSTGIVLTRYASFSANYITLRKQNTNQVSLFNKTSNVHIGDYVIDFSGSVYWNEDTIKWEDFHGGLLVGTIASNDGTTGVSRIALYDPVNDTFLITDGAPNNNYRFTSTRYDALTDVLTDTHRYEIYKYNSPLYLATINNLQAPVTKTAAQTMKVTYSLTEA